MNFFSPRVYITEMLAKFKYFLLLLFILPVVGFTQTATIEIKGDVDDLNTGQGLSGVTVSIYKNGSFVESVVTGSGGKYKFKKIDADGVITVKFAKTGFVGKYAEIDPTGIHPEDAGIFPLEVSTSIFEQIPDVDFSVLDSKPVAKAKYNKGVDNLEWDVTYIEKVKKEVDKIIAKAEEIKNNQANAAAATEKKFTDAVAAGNTAAASGNYTTAIEKYKEALAVKDDADVKKKLADAETKKIESENKAATDKKYNDLMTEAKKFFDAKDYASAKEKYLAASAVKNTEAAPKEKVKEIDAILAKNLEEETKYNKLLADGEKALLAENFDEAIKQFTEAGNLRKTEQLPKDQLKKAQDGKAAKEKDALAEKKKKEDFDKFVAAADASNTAKKYDDAITNYDKALALIDDPAVKTKKENAIKAKEADAEAAKKIEEEKEKERIRREEFDKLMKKGGDEMTATEFEKAIGTFESALIVIPKEPSAEAKLAEAKKKSDEKLANDKLAEAEKIKREKFDALLVKGDGEVGKTEYDKAIATFKEALVLIKDEPTAKTKLADAEKKKADFVKNKADFDKLVTEGDASHTGKKYDEAIAKYEKALTIFQEPAVQTKLDKVKADKDAADANTQAEKKKREDFNALLAQGDEEVKAESFDAAISKFEEALKLIPKEASAEAKLADAKSKKEIKEKNALAEKDKLAKKEQFDKLMAQGETELGAETYDKAITTFNAALAIIKDEPTAKAKLAEAELKKNNLAKNKADFDKLVSEGDVAIKSQKFEDAIAKYEKALAILKDDAVQTKLDKAKADRDLALGAAEAEKKKKEDFAKLILEGDTEVKSESYDAAISKYEEALKIIPKEASAETKLADAKKKRDDKLKNDQQAEELKKKQEEFDKLIAQGDSEMAASTFDNAITSYTAALAIFKDNATAKTKLAEAQKKKNEADLANKSAEEQKKLAEANYLKHYNAGKEFSNGSEFEKAITEFEAALVIKPADKDATTGLELAKQRLADYQATKDQAYKDRVAMADKLFGEGNYVDAKAQYVKANNQRPTDEHPKNRIVECDTKIKEAENAELAAKEKRKNYDAAKAKADELFKASKWDESIKQYELALTFLDEQYPKDQIELANTNKNNALGALEAEKKKKEDFAKLILEGDTEVKSESYDAAISKFEEALKLIPKEASAEAKLANAIKKRDEKLKNDQQAEELKKKQEEFDKLIAQGDSEMDASTFDNAITSYTAALVIFKDNATAKAKLAEATKKKKEFDLANKSAEEQKKLAEANYLKHYNAGKEFSNGSEFEKAITEFEAALGIKPNDPDATKGLELAKQRLADFQATKDQAYKDRVALADKLFEEGNYVDAKAQYVKANNQRPADEHPKNRIKECDEKIANEGEMKKLRQQFDAAMLSGDTELKAKNFDKAIAFYEAAKIILPKETTPDVKIEEAKRLKELAKSENDAAAKKKKFDQLMNEGNEFMTPGDFDGAIGKYEDALTVIPNEPTAVAAMALAKKRKKEQQEEIDKEIQRYLEFADKEFAASNWKDALKYYEKYESKRKNDPYAISQIAKCKEKIKAGQSNDELQANYDALVKAGNKLFGEKKYKESKQKFVGALDIFKSQAYPKKKIAEIDEILANQQAEIDRMNQQKVNNQIKKEKKGPNYGEKTIMSADEALALLQAAKLDDEKDKYAVIQSKKDKMSKDAQSIDKTAGETREENFTDIKSQKDLQKDYSQNTDLRDENTENYRNKQLQLEADTKKWNSENDVDKLNKAYVQAQYDHRDMNQYEERIRIINSKEINEDKDNLSSVNKVIDSQAATTRNDNGKDLVAKKDLLNDRYSANGELLIDRNSKEINAEFETLNNINKDQNEKANTIREQNRDELKEENDILIKQNKINQEKLMAENSNQVKNEFLNQHATNQYINSEAEKNRNEKSLDMNQRKDDFVAQNKFVTDKLLKENADETKNKFESQHSSNSEMNEQSADIRNKNSDILTARQDDLVMQQKTSQEKLLDENNAQVKNEFDVLNAQNDAIDKQSSQIRNMNGEILKDKKDLLANTTNQTSTKILEENGEQVKNEYEMLNEQNDRMDKTAADIRNKNSEELTKQQEDLKNTYIKGGESQAQKIKRLKEQQEEQVREQKRNQAAAEKKRWSNGQDLQDQKDQDMVFEKGQDGYQSSYTVDYPQGVTEEVYTRKDDDQNVSEVTIRRIVVKGEYGNEYRKVVSKSGTYYFKNGKTITNQTWDMEAAK
jgi:tetratricopeptide (TPR) repeat protein